MELLSIFITGAIASSATFLILRPKIKHIEKINNNIILENNKLEKLNADFKETEKKLRNEIENLSQRRDSINEEIIRVNNLLSLTNKQAEHDAKLIYKETMKIMQEELSNSAEKAAMFYRKAEEEYKEEFLKAIKDMAKIIEEYGKKTKDIQSKFAAAVEASKREQEKKDREKFYQLQLSETDIEEIEKIRTITPYLRNSEPLNKIIWKVYYEKPYTDLVGRVLGKNICTGIYKITNVENNMCYVGQCLDAASRWKQHIKRGIGAETPTKNKLYPAMLEYGVENFSFELIEQCPKEKLNEREQYWQDFFKAKEFGYSIK